MLWMNNIGHTKEEPAARGFIYLTEKFKAFYGLLKSLLFHFFSNFLSQNKNGKNRLN